MRRCVAISLLLGAVVITIVLVATIPPRPAPRSPRPPRALVLDRYHHERR